MSGIDPLRGRRFSSFAALRAAFPCADFSDCSSASSYQAASAPSSSSGWQSASGPFDTVSSSSRQSFQLAMRRFMRLCRFVPRPSASGTSTSSSSSMPDALRIICQRNA